MDIIVVGIMLWVLLWPYLRRTPEPPPRICRCRHPVPRSPEPTIGDPHEDLIRQINKAGAETHPVPPSPVMLPVLQPGESLEPLRTADGRIVRYVVVRD